MCTPCRAGARMDCASSGHVKYESDAEADEQSRLRMLVD
jgi:hypothetical protein